MVEGNAIQGDGAPEVSVIVYEDEEDVLAILTEEDLVLEDKDFTTNFDSLLSQIDCWLVGIYFPKSDLIAGM